MTAPFGFSHTFLSASAAFARPARPAPVAQPRWLAFNGPLAETLGGDPARWQGDAALAVFAGNAVPDDATPIALAYAGHQFGHFVPQLGDGRAILLGELTAPDGARFDLQLKGAGPTPFSRNGDGRAAMGPVLREFLVSEAMHALGVPTTRALAAVATGEPVLRDAGPRPGAVLARIAASHVRIGTFQYFAARQDLASLRTLVDVVIARHYPALAGADRPALALLQAVAARQAALVARWMHVGFIHGVMNTDNTAVSGETLDYGPCAFLDEYEPYKVFSSIDRNGRYAYGNQPAVLRWNLARLAECLLPLVDADGDAALAAAGAVVDAFPADYQAHWLAGMRAKLGLGDAEDDDAALAEDFLEALAPVEADYTLSFRRLADAIAGDGHLLPRTPAMDAWLPRWRARLARDPRPAAERAAAMAAVNPAVIPRNHLLEAALAAAEAGDLAPFEAMLAAVRRPYDDGPAAAPFMRPPEPVQRVLQTFCGT